MSEAVKSYTLEIKDIAEEQFRSMSIEELQAIAIKLTVTQFDDKDEQIKAILWGREFYTPKPKIESKSTPEETARYFAVEHIKETWSFKRLRLLALENGVAPIKGHPRHRETWINALIDAGVFKY